MPDAAEAEGPAAAGVLFAGAALGSWELVSKAEFQATRHPGA